MTDTPSTSPPDMTPGPLVVEQPATVTYPPVQQAIARIIGDLPSIGRDDKAPAKMGGYAFRGIEAVAAALQPLVAKHGVVIYPVVKVTGAEPAEGLSGWYDWRIEVTWQVMGPGGDRLDPAPVTHGIGRDNTDKGINKALTQARKYLLLILFNVADHQDDADGHDLPSPAAPERPESDRPLTEAQYSELLGMAKALTAEQREALAAEWTAEDPMTGDPLWPVRDGKPSIGHLTQGMVPAVTTMLRRYSRWAPAGSADTPEAPGEQQAAAEAPMRGDDDTPPAGPADDDTGY